MSQFDDEKALEYQVLEEKLNIARAYLEQSKASFEEKRHDVIRENRNTWESAAHGFQSNDFDAIVELTQCNNQIERSLNGYYEEKEKIARLERIIDNPYFSRIDFLFDGEETPESIYIGRAALLDKITGEHFIYDWRAPIASVFYRFMPGHAAYEAPCGIVEGELTRKRQYEIRHSKLEYYFDTNTSISDQFLKQLLAQNSSPKMKSIVETIQKEQDEVIRNMKNDLLMVQGVAGSGKTSIALHRAAYLLYPGQKTTLKSQNILIISPNTAFEEYISNVLPELGEENITSMVFEQLIKPAFEDRPLESKAKFLDKLMRLRHDWEGVREYILYKTSPVCKEDLDTFIETIPLKYVPLTDVRTSNGSFISKKYQREWLLKRKHIPLNIQLQQLKTHILDLSFGMERNRRAYSEEKNRFKQDFENRTRLDIFSLYESFMKEYFYIPWENRTVISYEDSMPLAYLYLKLFGCERYRDIKHVVIDEAQDYYPLQYEIFRLLFPNAKFTVLGDYLQTIEKPETMSLYQQIQVSLQKKNATLITLNKSFRCTSEILDFALSFLKKRPAVESFNRNGEVPSVFKAADRQALIQEIAEKASNWLKEGLESICLLTRSKADAYRLYEAIKGGLEVSMVNDSLPEGMKGLVVMPIYQSKGLEFDGVIICDADSEHYHDEDDRQLLYVASTRALHRLALMGIGEMSPLLP